MQSVLKTSNDEVKILLKEETLFVISNIMGVDPQKSRETGLRPE